MNKLTDGIEKAREASRDKLSVAKDNVIELASEGGSAAKERMSESKARAAELLGQGKDVASERAKATAVAAKDAAQQAAAKSGEVINRNPLAAVFGGLAIGTLIAALLPRTKVETKVVGSAGRKINETAKHAVEAAKEAGQEKMDEMGVSPGSLREQFKDLFGKALEVAKSAATAAEEAAREDKRDK